MKDTLVTHTHTHTHTYTLSRQHSLSVTKFLKSPLVASCMHIQVPQGRILRMKVFFIIRVASINKGVYRVTFTK